MSSVNPGWAYIDTDPSKGKSRWHFVDAAARSLCRRFVYLASMKPAKDLDKNLDNCPACRRLASRIAD